MIRVLIADDSPHILKSLSTLIAEQSDLNVVGTAGDAGKQSSWPLSFSLK